MQYIDLQDRFEADVHTLEVLLRLVELMHPSFGFSWVLQVALPQQAGATSSRWWVGAGSGPYSLRACLATGFKGDLGPGAGL